MAHDIKIAGITYSDVPGVAVPLAAGGGSAFYLDADGYVTLNTSQTISGAKTFLQSVRTDNEQTGNAAHSLGYGCNPDGKAGIWDYTHSRWLILNDSGGNTTLADGAVTITSGLTVSGGMVVSGGITGSCTSAGSAASAGYAINAGTATSCTGNAATATDASSLGGVAAATYMRKDVASQLINAGSGNAFIDLKTAGGTCDRVMRVAAQPNGRAGLYYNLGSGTTPTGWLINIEPDGSLVTSATATNASSLGGVAASGYVTTSDINTITSAAPTFYSGFEDFNAGSKVMAYRNGHVCQVTGAARASVAASGTGSQNILTLPAGYRPIAQYTCIQQGSGQNRFLMSVTTGGVVKIERYGVTSAVAVGSGSWLNMACTFICA